MNTCLSNICLKFAQIDARHLRMVSMVFTMVLTVGVILGLPIHGDVGG